MHKDDFLNSTQTVPKGTVNYWGLILPKDIYITDYSRFAHEIRRPFFLYIKDYKNYLKRKT